MIVGKFIRLKTRFGSVEPQNEDFSDPLLQQLMSDNKDIKESYDHTWFFIPSLQQDLENILFEDNIATFFVVGSRTIKVDITEEYTEEELLEALSL